MNNVGKKKKSVTPHMWRHKTTSHTMLHYQRRRILITGYQKIVQKFRHNPEIQYIL